MRSPGEAGRSQRRLAQTGETSTKRSKPYRRRLCRDRHQLDRRLVKRRRVDHPQQRIDDLRVELCPGVSPQLVDRKLLAGRAAIRAVRGHRLECVGDMDDPRLEWDVLIGYPVGITAAVDALVVVANPARLDGHLGGLDDALASAEWVFISSNSS